MARFGRFETVCELNRSGLTIVYSGRESGSAEEKYALKVFQPSPLILEDDEVRIGSRRFLDSARVQQNVTASATEYWAPVYDCGEIPEGAYYTTDKYDRSLQQLIDGRIKITNQVLHKIIESIIKGLVELKQACDRPHGNLKASNILIVGTGDISQTIFVLSDPLSDEQIDREAGWDSDLRAIAELIYELITHRPTPTVEGWQVPDSKEWAALGKQANGWRNLCNLLLSTPTKPGTITFETVLDELTVLKKIKPALSSRRLIAAGIVIIACVTVLVIFFRRPPPPEKTEWESLCKQYQAWIDGFRKDLAERDNLEQATKAIWSQDPKLVNIPEKIKIASYPYEVMLNEGKLYIHEIISHPEYAERRKTQDALTAIEEIVSIFDPNSPNAWLLLAKISNAANKFKNRRWQNSANYLTDLIESVKPEPNKPIVKAVDTILEFNQKGILQSIDLSLQNITNYEKTIQSLRDPILAKLDYVYVVNQVADANNVHELNDRLDKFVGLARKIAEVIDRDWETNIDKETFFSEHGNDSEENPTELTFTERLVIIREYYYLHPDPSEAITNLASDIDRYMKIALISNLQEANACARDMDQLRPKIEEIRKLKPIVKNEPQILERVDPLKPQLEQLLVRVEKAIETAEEFRKRIMAASSIAQAEEINEKWIELRDSLFQNHPLEQIKENLELYAQLRRRIDQINHNLTELDKTLQKELPSDIETQLTEKSWNEEIEQIFAQKRKATIKNIVKSIPFRDEVPDTNDTSFSDLCSIEFTKFGRWQEELGELIAAFNKIDDKLEDCYLLDDESPEADGTIRFLWDKWKETEVLKDTRIQSSLTGLIKRLQILEAIESYEDKQRLIDTVDQADSHTEAVYAAWLRIGQLPETSWPGHFEDLTKDRNIRDRLKKEFETIRGRNETRGDDLFKVLISTGLKHEIEFIDQNRSEDRILGKLIEFAAEVSPTDSLTELQKTELSTRDISDFVAGEDWQAGNIEKSLFSTESNVHNSDATITTETFDQWLTEVQDYKKLKEDPRSNSRYNWDEKLSNINTEINGELRRKPEENYLTELQSLKNDFDSIMQQIENMRKLPPIEKHKEEISQCENYWNELLEVDKKLRPDYCRRLELDNGRLIFAANSLHSNFEPVDVNSKNPVQLSTAWQQIRAAVNNKQREWLSFFYTIDSNDLTNVGWPKYIRSTTDPTVVFAFIPAGPGNSEPFYMAVHEISNRQYRLFLEKYGAKRGGPNLPGWSIFTDQTNNNLIQCTVANVPQTAIKWDESGEIFVVVEDQADHPVTWVTYYGAQSYAQWIKGQLPNTTQHKYACRAGTGNITPWGNNIEEIGNYAHVRGPAWQKAASEWSREKDRKVPPLPVAPVGAIKDYLQDKSLDPNSTVYTSDTYNSVWSIAGANRPNSWGLYDMIGNVWEWCQNDDDAQSVICGGSSVSPLRYVLLENVSDYRVFFSDRDNDVGFRVIVPAR